MRYSFSLATHGARNMAEKVTTVDLLRHGQCEGGEIFRGSTDVVLTELGWQQMRSATAAHEPWQRIFSSPLLRCRQFAEELAHSIHRPLTTYNDLQEMCFGRWEGMSYERVQREYAQALQDFWRDPVTHTPPGAESLTAFSARVLRCVDALLQEYQGERLLLVCHGAVIRVLMAHWLQMPLTAMPRIDVAYASLTRFRFYYQADAAPWIQLCFHRGAAND